MNQATTLQTVYTDLPLAALKHFNLNDLPINRKKAFIAEMQNRINEVVRNIILECLNETETLNEIENVLLANPEISDEKLLQKIVESKPETAKNLSAGISELYKNLTK